MRTGIAKERASLNIARLKKGGEHFEVVVDPDLAMAFKKGGTVAIADVLKDQAVFSDAQKGMLASEKRMQELFNSADPLRVAEIIIKEGMVQVTGEYRAKVREEKKRRILAMIQRFGVDPRTHAPHPLTRLENAFEEAKVRMDEMRSAEDQVQDVLKALRPVLPITFAVKRVEIIIPPPYAAQAYGIVKSFGTVQRDEWLGDGSRKLSIELPGGLEQDFYDKLNALTKGSVETKVIETR